MAHVEMEFKTKYTSLRLQNKGISHTDIHVYYSYINGSGKRKSIKTENVGYDVGLFIFNKAVQYQQKKQSVLEFLISFTRFN